MKLEKLVAEHSSKLNDNDFYILQYIYNNIEKCKVASIRDIAAQCNVSTATIVRFTQKLGLKGYSAFKFFLLWEDEGFSESAKQTRLNLIYRDFNANEKTLQQKDFSKICHLLYSSERIFLYGTSTTHKSVAREMQRTFLTTKKYLYIIDGETELNNILNDLTSTDVFIFISYGGNTPNLVPVIQQLKSKNIKYISMTRLGDNNLARNTPHNIFVSITPIKVLELDYATTALYFFAAEILFRNYIEYMETIQTPTISNDPPHL